MPAEPVELRNAVERFERLLIDTCVLIGEFKRPTGRFRDINRPQRATSIVAVWEFFHGRKGALLSQVERRDRHAWLQEQDIVPLPLSVEAGEWFERLLETEGPTQVADALLAAECLAQGIPLVTSNVRDFSEVTGLHYVAW